MFSPEHLALRAGICVCGALAQQHFLVNGRFIGCEGARRINEDFQALAAQPEQPQRAQHAAARVLEFVSR